MHIITDGSLQEIAALIVSADAVAIFAGAGMSVDSGLGQYRGTNGLWTKTLKVNNKKVNYYDLMKPLAFKEEPELAWGLIGFLMNKYENAIPHIGFSILKELLFKKEYFITTSNIDEQFQKAGLNKKRIFEIHGSIFNSQCMYNIECDVWDTPDIIVDPETVVADSFPMCPECNSYCRPNVHLFEDDFFVSTTSAEQNFRYFEWQEKIKSKCKNIIALEIGAGKTISTIRRYSEEFAGINYPLIRINPNDFETFKTNHFSIPIGAKDFLVQVKELVDRKDCPF